jgi:pyruvate/2-oxoglutarate dehydrogenase complex dihydrolipoamide dehydrogenase (E3) component
MPEFDAIIIGTGQAGPALCRRLTAAGMQVAIVERHRFGGTCVNTGCTPTKTLVASAYAAHTARRAADYGIKIQGSVQTDMKQVKARMHRVVARSSTAVERSLRSNPRCTVYAGHARFVSSYEVAVGDAILHAERIFINVGGRAHVPDLPGLAQIDYFTNSSILEIDFVPPHLIVVGGSYVGLELAQIYRRFGSMVTVIEMAPRLSPREDEDVSEGVADILRREGIELRVGSRDLRIERRGEGFAVSLRGGDGTAETAGTHLLLAAGRRPNTDDLGLDRAGVTTDARGFITVDDSLQTNVSSIWALGDCNGKGAFTHTAYNDFEIVAANLLDNDPRRVSDRIMACNLYTDPPLGRVGMTEAEVRKSGRPALMATMPMERVSRAIEKDETQGFMKVLVDAESKQILGASILGLGGDEVVHCILALMYAKAPYTVMERSMPIHPTVSELIPTLLADLRPL